MRRNVKRTPAAASPPQRDPSAKARLLVVAIAAGITAVHAVRLHPWMLDDSFISFRYAEFLAGGAGPVFNPGERVEGYTSFLWVVLLAAAKAVGCDTVIASWVYGAVFSLATLVGVAYADRFLPSIAPRAALAATLLLGTCGTFTPWARSGMEVPLFTFLVLAVVLRRASLATPEASRSGRLQLGVLCAFAALARPEGLVLAAIVLGECALRVRLAATRPEECLPPRPA